MIEITYGQGSGEDSSHESVSNFSIVIVSCEMQPFGRKRVSRQNLRSGMRRTTGR